MKIENALSDTAVLKELGTRIARYRLNKNMTQEALARDAGISLPTLRRVELGHTMNATNLLRILRSLKLLEHLDALLPETIASPLQQMKARGKIRRRASAAPPVGGVTPPWLIESPAKDSR